MSARESTIDDEPPAAAPRLTYPRVFDTHERRLCRVDKLYELMTAPDGDELRAMVAGIRIYSAQRYELLLASDRRARALFDAHFQCLSHNDWRARVMQLATLLTRIRFEADIKAYFAPRELDAEARVDRRAFAHWETRYLLPAVDDLYSGKRMAPDAFVAHLVSAYAACLRGDASEHPRAGVLDDDVDNVPLH